MWKRSRVSSTFSWEFSLGSRTSIRLLGIHDEWNVRYDAQPCLQVCKYKKQQDIDQLTYCSSSGGWIDKQQCTPWKSGFVPEIDCINRAP